MPVESTLVARTPTTQNSLRPAWARGLAFFRPSHAHTVFSATIVLMTSTFLSRIIGLVRVKYIVWLFGRGFEADAFNAAFVLPDMISYFLVPMVSVRRMASPPPAPAPGCKGAAAIWPIISGRDLA